MHNLNTLKSRRLNTNSMTKPSGESLLLNPCFDDEACQKETRALGHCFNTSGMETNNQGQGEDLDIEAEKASCASKRTHQQTIREEYRGKKGSHESMNPILLIITGRSAEGSALRTAIEVDSA